MAKRSILVPFLFFLLVGCLLFSPAVGMKINQPVYMFEKPEIATIDSHGAVYITGGTNAPSFNIDGTPKSSDNETSFGLFLIKIDPETQSPDYSTWYPQAAYVDGTGIVVDQSGSAHILVESESKNYPASWNLSGDGSERGSYITRFNKDGTGIDESYRIFSTQHHSYKPAKNLVRSPDGSLYLAIGTADPSFPLTHNFLDTENGGNAAIVIKISPDGKSIVYADRIGSKSGFILRSMDVAPDGSAYISGFSWGEKLNATGFQKVYRGQADGIVAKISPDGEHLEYITYIGGSGIDRAISIRSGSDGSAFIAGTTTSDDFPLKNPSIMNRTGFYEGFAEKISPDGQQLLWSTYLGAMNDYEPITIVPDTDGGAWVAGGAGANMSRDSKNRIGVTGNGDAFLVKISSEGKIVAPPVVFGGHEQDIATGLVLDKKGNPFVFGTTRSPDFPLKNSLNSKVVPGFAMFAASFNATDQTMVYSTYIGGPTAYTNISSALGNKASKCIPPDSQGIVESIISFFAGKNRC